LTRLRTGNVTLLVSLLDRNPGSSVRVRVPAREVVLAPMAPGPTSIHNVVQGQVRAVTLDQDGRAALVEVALPDQAGLLARISIDSVEGLRLVVGEPVVAMIKSESVEVMPG
jgi:molybdate transport system ATP-binding protein